MAVGRPARPIVGSEHWQRKPPVDQKRSALPPPAYTRARLVIAGSSLRYALENTRAMGSRVADVCSCCAGGCRRLPVRTLPTRPVGVGDGRGAARGALLHRRCLKASLKWGAAPRGEHHAALQWGEKRVSGECWWPADWLTPLSLPGFTVHWAVWCARGIAGRKGAAICQAKSERGRCSCCGCS